MTFNELVKKLRKNGLRLVKERGSKRWYWKEGLPKPVRVDYHGAKEIKKGTAQGILKQAGIESEN